MDFPSAPAGCSTAPRRRGQTPPETALSHRAARSRPVPTTGEGAYPTPKSSPVPGGAYGRSGRYSTPPWAPPVPPRRPGRRAPPDAGVWPASPPAAWRPGKSRRPGALPSPAAPSPSPVSVRSPAGAPAGGTHRTAKPGRPPPSCSASSSWVRSRRTRAALMFFPMPRIPSPRLHDYSCTPMLSRKDALRRGICQYF